MPYLRLFFLPLRFFFLDQGQDISPEAEGPLILGPENLNDGISWTPMR